MKEIKLSVGRSGFEDIRKNGYYYVDKSDWIRELLRTDGRQVTLITCARKSCFLTGYLTRVREGQLRSPLPEGCTALRIPNREIKEIFETTIDRKEKRHRQRSVCLFFLAIY